MYFLFVYFFSNDIIIQNLKGEKNIELVMKFGLLASKPMEKLIVSASGKKKSLFHLV